MGIPVSRTWINRRLSIACLGAFAATTLILCATSLAGVGGGGGFFGRSVGGVVVDANGVIRSASVDERNQT